jgi:hypothetical protein
MTMEIRRVYGLSSNVFVAPKVNTQAVVIGGIGEDTGKWTRVISLRAAQLLWFHLTQQLFPDKAAQVTAAVHTAQARGFEMPTITTHVTVDRLDGGQLEITGWVGEQTWAARLTPIESQRLWNALDIALYPRGWRD